MLYKPQILNHSILNYNDYPNSTVIKLKKDLEYIPIKNITFRHTTKISNLIQGIPDSGKKFKVVENIVSLMDIVNNKSLQIKYNLNSNYYNFKDYENITYELMQSYSIKYFKNNIFKFLLFKGTLSLIDIETKTLKTIISIAVKPEALDNIKKYLLYYNTNTIDMENYINKFNGSVLDFRVLINKDILNKDNLEYKSLRINLLPKIKYYFDENQFVLLDNIDNYLYEDNRSKVNSYFSTLHSQKEFIKDLSTDFINTYKLDNNLHNNNFILRPVS